MAIINGTAGDDILVGTAGIDFLGGLGGNDELTGDEGADILDGGTGIDTARYDGAAGRVDVDLALNQGTAGEALGDQLFGFENVTGSQFNDVIRGNGFDNVLRGLGGSDRVDGFSGIDTVDYAASQARVRVSLRNGTGFDGDAAGDKYTSIENVTGSAFDDELEGDGFANVLSGGGGNDVIQGGAGADVLAGGSGIDTLDYRTSSGFVIVDLTNGTTRSGDAEGDKISGFENLIGGNSNDGLHGNDAANVLSGGAGIDNITGRGGDDTIAGGAGADTLDGGSGIDRLDYRSSAAFVQVDLASGEGFFNDAEGDTVSGFEIVFGSDSGDLLLGNDVQNALSGGAGNDAIAGRGGDDLIMGGAGADSMQGGSGKDVLDYRFSTFVQVDLASGKGFFGDAEGDTFAGFEDLIGSHKGDALFGNDAANVLHGVGGGDGISGRGGNDTLVGGLGADALDGGAGADTFRYFSTTESALGVGGRDVITGFTRAADKIDLVVIDAQDQTSGNQAFSFIKGQAFTAQGQVRFFFEGDHTVVQLNTSGATGAESEIELAGNINLTAGDFIL